MSIDRCILWQYTSPILMADCMDLRPRRTDGRCAFGDPVDVVRCLARPGWRGSCSSGSRRAADVFLLFSGLRHRYGFGVENEAVGFGLNLTDAAKDVGQLIV